MTYDDAEACVPFIVTDGKTYRFEERHVHAEPSDGGSGSARTYRRL